MYVQLDTIDEDKIAAKIEIVQQLLNGKKIIVAFSGGVDSVVVAHLAKTVATDVLLIMQVGSSVGIGEQENAQHVAQLLQLPLEFLEYDEYVESDAYARNPPNRCYYCKDLLHDKLEAIRKTHNFDVVVGGTNFSDLFGHRPGYAAVQEHNALSPLITAQLTKLEIRWIARQVKLPVWDKPATPCIASRVHTGIPITAERLQRIRTAEYTLKQHYNFRVLRVRETEIGASVEVGSTELSTAQRHWNEIADLLRTAGYMNSTLNENGYKPYVP